MTDIQTCPRRMHEMGPWDRSEGIDQWIETPRQAGELTPTCSFCGSLHPGKFLEMVAQDWVVGPTDKSYKAYLHPVQSGEPMWAKPGDPLPEISPQVQSKFYYQHLSASQQGQFVDLYNHGQMHISMPGYFYVLPFFMTIAPRDAAPEG